MATETWIVSGPQVIDIDTVVTSLRVNALAGRVAIVAHDEATTRVEVHRLSGRPIEVNLSDEGALVVTYPFISWDNPIEKISSFWSRERAEISIAVPRSVYVWLNTVSADGLLAGSAEGADVKTVSGRIVLDSVRGDVLLKTVSGDLDVRELDGTIAANSVSGALTASGNVKRVGLNTVSGDVTLDLVSSSTMVKVTGVSSDVTVRRPAGLPVTAQLSTTSGRVVIDGIDYGKGNGRNVVDSRNDGALVWLEVKTVSGHVTVLASAPLTEPGEEAPQPEASSSQQATGGAA